MPRKTSNEDRLESIVCSPVSPKVRDAAILLLGHLEHWERRSKSQPSRPNTREGLLRLISENLQSRRILNSILEPIARGDAGFFEEIARLIRGGLKTRERVAIAVQDFVVSGLSADHLSGPELSEFVSKVPGLEDVDESTVRKTAKKLGVTFRERGRPKKSGRKSKRRPG
jgi:hypothetical protein